MTRVLGWFLASTALAAPVLAQSPDYERVVVPSGRSRAMKPTVWGSHHAVASMSAHATLAGESILRAGGNAFDAIVAGQAVLGLVQPASNGIGGDATLLVYDAKQKKVWSINAEGTAPKLATIEWYRGQQRRQAPGERFAAGGHGARRHRRLVPAAVAVGNHDARAGAGSGHRTGRARLPVVAPRSAIVGRQQPDQVSVECPPLRARRQALGRGRPVRNLDLARTFRRLIEAEKGAAAQGREAALKAARDRFYKGDIAREMADFSEENGGLFRYEDFASYSAKVEEPVFVQLSRLRGLQEPFRQPGPGRASDAEPPRGLRSEGDGP